MAKGNIFLGMSRGKVGDVVFTRLNGDQVTRVRNRQPKNPQSPTQMLQRIVLNTSSKAYSLLQDIANHSFEGFSQGTANQSAFMRANVEMLRQKLTYELAFPTEEVMLASTQANFNQKGDTSTELNEYIISSGSLQRLLLQWTGTAIRLDFVTNFGTAPTLDTLTYADVIEGLGAQRGDQLTFCIVTYDSSNTRPREFATAFKYARIILEPSDGDTSVKFLTGSEAAGFYVSAPNARNEGTVRFTGVSGSGIMFDNVNRIGQAIETPILAAVIHSRLSGNRWLRSSQSLVWMQTANSIPNADLFSDAFLSYQQGASSSLYLNQAE